MAKNYSAYVVAYRTRVDDTFPYEKSNVETVNGSIDYRIGKNALKLSELKK